MELRETIEALRTRNEEAQAVIHGALNTPENMKGWTITGWPFLIFHLPLLTLVALDCQTCKFNARTRARASPASTV